MENNPGPLDSSALMAQMSRILEDYLSENSRRSLNALSRRCTVSEPTLRRLLKGQVKTLPNVTTILDVLTTISGEKSPRKIAELYPGPVAEYLRTMALHFEDCETAYDPSLNMELRNPASYIIYKLAANNSGVTKAKISELFGAQGLLHLENLVRKGFVEAKTEDVFVATSQNFTGSHGDFVTNFKAVADFIKLRDLASAANLNPLLVNYSESISAEAYREIVAIQKAALKKIRGVLADPASAGPLPAFLLLAVDTLDLKTAGELAE